MKTLRQLIEFHTGQELDDLVAYHRLGYRNVCLNLRAGVTETDDQFRTRILARIG